jgi:elongation factor Tu
MPVVTENCPSCGAPLTLEAGRCAYCHVPVVVTAEGAVSQPVPANVVDPDAPFSMKVDDVFVIGGRGTIATGKVASGSICVGDALIVEGAKRPVKTSCTGIEMFRKQMQVASVGDNVGILLSGVDKSTIAVGSWLRAAPH